MLRRKKEEKAINPQPYTSHPYTNPISKREILSGEVKEKTHRIEWKDLVSERQEKDLLAFMGDFEFPDLDDLRVSLVDSGKYKKEEIEEIVAGLKTLPEYK